MTAASGAVDVGPLAEAVRTLDEWLRASPETSAQLAADAVALGARLDAYRERLAAVAAAGLDGELAPATVTRAVAAALAATDLDAAVRALRDAEAPVAPKVAPAALRVRLGLAFRLCAAALAGLAAREAP